MARIATFKPGDPVVYIPWGGRAEDGIVTSVNDRFVFVRFTGQHPDAPGKACHPDMVYLAGGL